MSKNRLTALTTNTLEKEILKFLKSTGSFYDRVIDKFAEKEH